MSSHHPARHCFVEGRFYTAGGHVVLKFTEGELYRFLSVGITKWNELKTDATRGHDWNLKLIAFWRTNTSYYRVASFPSGASDSFYSP